MNFFYGIWIVLLAGGVIFNALSIRRLYRHLNETRLHIAHLIANLEPKEEEIEVNEN